MLDEEDQDHYDNCPDCQRRVEEYRELERMMVEALIAFTETHGNKVETLVLTTALGSMASRALALVGNEALESWMATVRKSRAVHQGDPDVEKMVATMLRRTARESGERVH